MVTFVVSMVATRNQAAIEARLACDKTGEAEKRDLFGRAVSDAVLRVIELKLFDVRNKEKKRSGALPICERVPDSGYLVPSIRSASTRRQLITCLGSSFLSTFHFLARTRTIQTTLLMPVTSRERCRVIELSWCLYSRAVQLDTCCHASNKPTDLFPPQGRGVMPCLSALPDGAMHFRPCLSQVDLIGL